MTPFGVYSVTEDCGRYDVSQQQPCNCCGDEALRAQLEQLQRWLRQLELRIQQISSKSAPALSAWETCDGRELPRNAQIVTCQNLQQALRKIEEQRKKNRFRDCAGRFLAQDAKVVDCARFNELKNEVRRIADYTARDSTLLQLLEERMQALERAMGHAGFGGNIDKNTIDGILRRLAELEDCCQGHGNDGGDCDFDGWGYNYSNKRLDKESDVKYQVNQLRLQISGPAYKTFTIFGPGEMGQVIGITDSEGNYFYENNFSHGIVTGPFKVVHCGEVVIDGTFRET